MFAALVFLTCFIFHDTHAQDSDVEVIQKFTPKGRHRLDFSYTRYDTFSGRIDQFLSTYTWAPRQYLRLSITGTIVSSDIPGGDPFDTTDDLQETGTGDTLIGIQFDPSKNLTASPWVPDSVGFFAQLLAPTGNAEKGLGTDQWLATAGAGWAVDTFSHLWLVPAVGYEFSFSEDLLATPTNQPYLSVDFIWVFEFGAWVGVSPRIGYEIEESEWVDQYLITFGKMFQNGFGASVDFGRTEQINPQASRDDRVWLINLYYQFGKPPGASTSR